MSNARELAQIPSTPSGRRNLIINGAMNVAQRGTSISLAHDGTRSGYAADRFAFTMTSSMDSFDGALQQVTDCPEGFAHSIKWTTGTAESAITSDELSYLYYIIEAQDLQHLQFGTSNAKTLTLSFYAKSSVAGSYVGSIYKGDTTARQKGFSYTVNAPNTWEKKTITITGDTDSSATIADDNGEGLRINWILAAGSSYKSTDNSDWVNYADATWAYGHTNDAVVTTANATFQITGVQLEVGTVATEFEHLSYGEELALCQRYLYRIGRDISGQATSAHNGTWWSSGSFYGVVPFPVKMRGQPTFSGGSVTDGYAIYGAGYAYYPDSVAGVQAYGLDSMTIYYADDLSGVAGHSGWCQLILDDAYLQFDAEL